VVDAGKFAPVGKRGMFTSRQGFGVEIFQGRQRREPAHRPDRGIVGVRNLSEIIAVDHIDVFFVAPSDLATSMGHIDMGHGGQQTIDGAITKIVQASRWRHAGDRRQRRALREARRRCFMASFFPWIQAGAKDLMDRAAKGAKG
jgi:4-hydroxy-2-oxoheptanedioate aldolase